MNTLTIWVLWQVCATRSGLPRVEDQVPGNRQQLIVGTATVAIVLNGLGFSNWQLNLLQQFFANKPEHLQGVGIKAEMFNDDCLGHNLNWLYAHDSWRLFAGIAGRARQIFSIQTRQVNVD